MTFRVVRPKQETKMFVYSYIQISAFTIVNRKIHILHQHDFLICEKLSDWCLHQCFVSSLYKNLKRYHCHYINPADSRPTVGGANFSRSFHRPTKIF